MDMITESLWMLLTGSIVTSVIAGIAWYWSPVNRYERQLRKEFDV